MKQAIRPAYGQASSWGAVQLPVRSPPHILRHRCRYNLQLGRLTCCDPALVLRNGCQVGELGVGLVGSHNVLHPPLPAELKPQTTHLKCGVKHGRQTSPTSATGQAVRCGPAHMLLLLQALPAAPGSRPLVADSST